MRSTGGRRSEGWAITTYYVRTDGSDANNGLTDSAGGAWLTLAHAGATVAAGDTVMVRASAGNAASYPTSSLDYTIASFFTPTAGSVSAGFVKWVGYNGVPTIGSPGLGFYNCVYNWWEGLYFCATSAANASFGVLNGAIGLNVAKNVTVNVNSQSALPGIAFSGGLISGCEVYGGSTSPASSSGAYGIQIGNYNTLVHGCRVRYCGDHGIIDANGAGGDVRDNLIYGNKGRGITGINASTVPTHIIGNTIDANGSDGIGVTATAGAPWYTIRNNIISNNGGYGIAVTGGATALNDQRKTGWDYNDVYNNTSGAYQNVSAGANDLAVNPSYANAAGSPPDYTPTNAALKGAGFPTSWPGG